ncbi:histone-like nucleoid-structuring protein Lsr2 [Rhodococcus sp. 3Y1]
MDSSCEKVEFRQISQRSGDQIRPVADRDQSAAIREWAKGAGFEISARGRISTEVRRAYEKAV